MYKYSARVTRVIDGDTFVMTVDLGFKIFTEIKVRLFGVDAPENRGSNREVGLKVTEEVKRKLEQELQGDDNVKLQTLGKDRWGRWVGIIYNEEETLNINIELQKFIDETIEKFERTHGQKDDE